MLMSSSGNFRLAFHLISINITPKEKPKSQAAHTENNLRQDRKLYHKRLMTYLSHKHRVEYRL